ncbi:hypothetical protein [Streptomyces sp. NPDC091268]|uniref:hypothetical protein n=1 Tax=Streptomyces sp. NPDC091268 TaxID=3365979 RepID=UPI0038138889
MQDGEELRLVIEELDHRPFTRWDNAVVHRADGTELRPHPPWELLSEPSRVAGFHTAYLDGEGLPMLVLATSSGDLQGRLDLESGEVTDLRPWR